MERSFAGAVVAVALTFALAWPARARGEQAEEPVEAEAAEGDGADLSEAAEAEEALEADDDVAEAPTYESVARASRPVGSATEWRVSGLAIATAPRRSAEDLLRLVPGLLIVQHGAEGKGHQIFLRGFDAAHGTDVEVLVAGIPINMLSNVHGHGYLDLNFIPAEVLGSMEILPGSFDVMQGDLATAGSLRLGLGVPEAERGTRVGYEGGLTNRHRVFALHAPAGTGRSFATAELLTDDGYGSSRWSRRASFMGRLDGGALGDPEVTLGLYAAAFGSPNAVRVDDLRAGRIGFLDTYTDDLEGRTARAFLAASQQVDLGASRLRVVAGATLTRFDLESNYTGFLQSAEHGDTRRQRHDAIEGYLQTSWEMGLRALGRPLRLRAAAEWRGDFIQQDEAMILLPSREPWRVDRDAAAGTHRVGLAASAFWAPLAWLQAEAGVRGDLFVIDFEDTLDGGARYEQVLYAVSPRARLRFPIARDWTLFASYGRGFRSPEARSVAVRSRPDEDVDLDLYTGGEPEVTASDAVEAGVRVDHGGWIEASAAGFATFIDNETIFDHVSGTNLALNATRRLGGEVDLRVRPLPWLEARVDLTAVDARFVESGAPVPGAPWLLATFGVSAAHRSGLSGSLSGLYVAPRPLAHGATGSHQFVLALRAAYRWRWIEVGVDMENLLGSEWMEGEYHFASWFDQSSPRSLIPVTHYTAGPPFSLRAGLTFWI